MADLHASPISQLLHSMGMTREDLNKRSNEMRQFLTANDSLASRVDQLSSAGYRSRSSSDLPPATRSSSSSFSVARSLSRASSQSMRELSPPTTPIKIELPESGPSMHRHMDNMEMVIERQRQTRRERKSKRERERVVTSKPFVAPASPSPGNTSLPTLTRNSFLYPHDELFLFQTGEGADTETSSTSGEAGPVTPQKKKYYREHTMDNANSQPRKDTTCKTETPTPTRSLYPYMAFPNYIPAQGPPVTPQKHPRPIGSPTPTQKALEKMPSPMPSSPFPASSSPPRSSPAPRILHHVSSPGPMEPLPSEDQYDRLPYRLPPGPYSENKPDLSYAALVGQAIISSTDHRLTLQEIYDWITIVYPHYKRGETTWMNSIRHVLSTTACFRKVPRDRSVGRTLWAIFDDDLECFKGGGFRKHLCKDIMSQQKEKAKKATTRKRPEMDESNDTRKSKKARKDSSCRYAQTSAPVHVIGPQPSFMATHPYFPRPTQHQPYYESCMPQSHPQMLPAEIIFPPLPPDAALRAARVIMAPAPPLPSSSRLSSPPADMEKAVSESSIPSSEQLSSRMSVPDLTPNRSSSTTPPSSLPATSDMDVEIIDDTHAEGRKDWSTSKTDVAIAGVDTHTKAPVPTADDDNVFNGSLLGPVQFWGESPRTAGLLAPSIELVNFDSMTDDEDESQVKDKKGKGRAGSRKNSLYPPVSSSPTLSVRSNIAIATERPLSRSSIERPKTPVKSGAASSSAALPSTPPQRMRLSSSRTPISHKGLTMSPSASLAHYKSNLDPPPVLFQPGANKLLSSLAPESEAMESDLMRTPRRSSGGAASSSSALGPPVTPKKGPFDSPFRTPRSRDIYDPHDPRLLLDEELSRPVLGDSPLGIFGKRSSLLYDSPGADPWGSPGKKWYW